MIELLNSFSTPGAGFNFKNGMAAAESNASDSGEGSILYKRSHFVTRLPKDRLYTPAHFWMEKRSDSGVWRVGATKFATRMLGEMVDHGLEVDAGNAVEIGQVIGWLEGFKAVSDLFCSVEGKLVGGNDALLEDLTWINRKPFAEGWLYEASGEPDSRAMNVEDYQKFLDQVIDQLLEKDPNLGAPEDS